MPRNILLAVAFWSLVVTAPAGATPLPGDVLSFTTELHGQIPAWMGQYGIPGVAVALVHDGQVVWAEGYGAANKADGTPVTTDTVFQVASISKVISAWGVMKLVEQGILALDAPVEAYLTRWHLPPSDFDINGVTVERILSHIAGLSLGGYPGWEPDHRLPLLEASLSGDTNGSGDLRLVNHPGEKWSYSGGGYTLLQLVIEEVSGQSFADYMQQNILNSLGMTSSTYQWSADLGVAVGYNTLGQALPNYLFTEQAPAGLYTTVRDLGQFVAATMPSTNQPVGRGVLSPETLTTMFQPMPSTGDSQGLGYALEYLPDGTRLLQHGGSNRGWKAHMDVIPERGEGLVVLTNSDLGEELIADIRCSWMMWLTDTTPDYCRKEASKNIFLAAGVIGLLISAYAISLVLGLRNGQRQVGWPLPGKRPWRRIWRVGIPLLLVGLFWGVIYSDIPLRMATGVSQITARQIVPGAFDWLAMGVVIMGILFSLSAFIPKTPVPRDQ